MSNLLDSHPLSLLKQEYAAHLPATPPVLTVAAIKSHVDPPSEELVDAIEFEAAQNGIPAGSVDWATLIPQIIAAIASKNWLALIPIMVNLGPTVWAFVEQIINSFHKMSPSAPEIKPAS